MALTKAKDALGKPLDPNALYQCVESFAGDFVNCARGLRLLGSSEVVQRHGATFFVPDDTPDDVIHELLKERWVAK